MYHNELFLICCCFFSFLSLNNLLFGHVFKSWLFFSFQMALKWCCMISTVVPVNLADGLLIVVVVYGSNEQLEVQAEVQPVLLTVLLEKYRLNTS